MRCQYIVVSFRLYVLPVSLLLLLRKHSGRSHGGQATWLPNLSSPLPALYKQDWKTTVTSGRTTVSHIHCLEARSSYIEAGIAGATGVQITQHAFKGARCWKICKKGGMLPVRQPCREVLVSCIPSYVELHVHVLTWNDELLIVIRNLLKVFTNFRGGSCDQTVI